MNYQKLSSFSFRELIEVLNVLDARKKTDEGHLFSWVTLLTIYSNLFTSTSLIPFPTGKRHPASKRTTVNPGQNRSLFEPQLNFHALASEFHIFFKKEFKT